MICPVLCTPFQVLAMNLSAPFLVQFFGEQMSAALAYSDYVFGNETEAAAFGEKQGWGSDLETTALKLAGKNTCWCRADRSKVPRYWNGSDCLQHWTACA